MLQCLIFKKDNKERPKIAEWAEFYMKAEELRQLS
jgi:hypothetical protein